jgi:hypothetical protein
MDFAESQCGKSLSKLLQDWNIEVDGNPGVPAGRRFTHHMKRLKSDEEKIRNFFSKKAPLVRYLRQVECKKYPFLGEALEYVKSIYDGYTKDKAKINLNSEQIAAILHFGNSIIPEKWNLFCDPANLKTAKNTLNIRLIFAHADDAPKDHLKFSGWSNPIIIYYRGVWHTTIFLSFPLSSIRTTLIHELAHVAVLRKFVSRRLMRFSRFRFEVVWDSILDPHRKEFHRFHRCLKRRAKGVPLGIRRRHIVTTPVKKFLNSLNQHPPRS